jgi:hypothetical protein
LSERPKPSWAAEKGLAGAGQAPFMDKIMTTSLVITSNVTNAELFDSSKVTLRNSLAEKAFSFHFLQPCAQSLYSSTACF